MKSRRKNKIKPLKLRDSATCNKILLMKQVESGKAPSHRVVYSPRAQTRTAKGRQEAPTGERPCQIKWPYLVRSRGSCRHAINRAWHARGRSNKVRRARVGPHPRHACWVPCPPCAMGARGEAPGSTAACESPCLRASGTELESIDGGPVMHAGSNSNLARHWRGAAEMDSLLTARGMFQAPAPATRPGQWAWDPRRSAAPPR